MSLWHRHRRHPASCSRPGEILFGVLGVAMLALRGGSGKPRVAGSGKSTSTTPPPQRFPARRPTGTGRACAPTDCPSSTTPSSPVAQSRSRSHQTNPCTPRSTSGRRPLAEICCRQVCQCRARRSPSLIRSTTSKQSLACVLTDSRTSRIRASPMGSRTPHAAPGHQSQLAEAPRSVCGLPEGCSGPDCRTAVEQRQSGSGPVDPCQQSPGRRHPRPRPTEVSGIHTREALR